MMLVERGCRGAMGADTVTLAERLALVVEPSLQANATAGAWHVAHVLSTLLQSSGVMPARAVRWRVRGVGIGFAGVRYPAVAVDQNGEVRMYLSEGNCAVGVEFERICCALRNAGVMRRRRTNA